MLTEFEVKRRMEAIRLSPVPASRKVRLFLRLGICLRRQAKALSLVRARLARSADKKASAGLDRMVHSAEALRADIREEAVCHMRPDNSHPAEAGPVSEHPMITLR